MAGILSVEQKKVLEQIERTADQFFSKEEFVDLLASGKKLRIKFGVDVTASTIHIGHAVNLWMMRALQDAGHKVIFLIGDFTTRIGDPTGRDKRRPVISKEDIDRHAAAFIDQAKMVLRFDDPGLLEIRRNSEWLEPMPTHRFLELLTMITHARLISRDMFQKRMAEGSDIHMHELIYPILQGCDSVALESDLTIIGSDQLFNEMLGRFYQEKMGQRPQAIITSIITPGPDGGAKQSKSLDNYIGLSHSPRDKFGRVMRVIDLLIEQYFVVYTGWPMEKIEAFRDDIARNPLAAKQALAHAIVERYHGRAVADAERDWWIETFSNRAVPEDIPEVKASTDGQSAFNLVRLCLPDASKAEIRRLFAQGAVAFDDRKVTDPDETIPLAGPVILKVGKRKWYRIVPE